MSLFYGGIGSSALATIFVIYRFYEDVMIRRMNFLRQRVAFMVWMAAQEAQ